MKYQLCVSNPQLVRILTEETRKRFQAKPNQVIFGMGPNDAGGFCQCGDCQALDGNDPDPYLGYNSVTDRYVWLFNQILQSLESEFPDKKIGFYAYHAIMRPPVKFKPHRNLAVALAPISLCRVHGPNNPVCEESSYYGELLRQWGKLVAELYDRGYWSNLADPGLPFPMMHRLRVQIPLAHQLGVKGWRVECFHHWAGEMPSLFVACRLMWDHTADVDALLADFCERFYGPAASVMGDYHRHTDRLMRQTDQHTGGSFRFQAFYPKPARGALRRLLDQAQLLAPDEPYKSRVAMVRQGFDYGQAFIAMFEARDAHDYAAAYQAYVDYKGLQGVMAMHDPPLVNARLAPSYSKRFYEKPIIEAYLKTQKPNRLLLGLEPRWQFRKEGEQKWSTLSSVLSWSDQGLRYFKGECWYRQSFDLTLSQGQSLHLWFGGVDERAEVWLNEQRLGVSPGKAFEPFEFDISQAARTGQNELKIKITNRRLDELGTGGIVAPVMIYAKPRN